MANSNIRCQHASKRTGHPHEADHTSSIDTLDITPGNNECDALFVCPSLHGKITMHRNLFGYFGIIHYIFSCLLSHSISIMFFQFLFATDKY